MYYYLNLGSNLGDREGNIWVADLRIALDIGLVTARSDFFESEPWGFDSSNVFLNRALAVESQEEPQRVLELIHDIERELGAGAGHRDEHGRYIDRVIDIDIMAIDDMIIDTPTLTVPHRHLPKREFYLKPFMEIAPDWRHPATGLTCQEMLSLIAFPSRQNKK